VLCRIPFDVIAQYPQSYIALRVLLDLLEVVFHRVGASARGPAVELQGYTWWPKVEDSASAKRKGKGKGKDSGKADEEPVITDSALLQVRSRMRAASDHDNEKADRLFCFGFGKPSVEIRAAGDAAAHSMPLTTLSTLLSWRLYRENKLLRRREPNEYVTWLAARDLFYLILGKHQAETGHSDFASISFAAIALSSSFLIVSGRGVGRPQNKVTSVSDPDLAARLDALEAVKAVETYERAERAKLHGTEGSGTRRNDGAEADVDLDGDLQLGCLEDWAA
jgi:hypothetical protein